MDELFDQAVSIAREHNARRLAQSNRTCAEREIATARTLARTCGPQTSKDAAEKLVKSGELNRQEEMIYEAIVRSNLDDFTTKNIAYHLSAYEGLAYHQAYDICRKRFSGLKNKGKIELTGGRRDGCRVWRLK